MAPPYWKNDPRIRSKCHHNRCWTVLQLLVPCRGLVPISGIPNRLLSSDRPKCVMYLDNRIRMTMQASFVVVRNAIQNCPCVVQITFQIAFSQSESHSKLPFRSPNHIRIAFSYADWVDWVPHNKRKPLGGARSASLRLFPAGLVG